VDVRHEQEEGNYIELTGSCGVKSDPICETQTLKRGDKTEKTERLADMTPLRQVEEDKTTGGKIRLPRGGRVRPEGKHMPPRRDWRSHIVCGRFRLRETRQAPEELGRYFPWTNVRKKSEGQPCRPSPDGNKGWKGVSSGAGGKREHSYHGRNLRGESRKGHRSGI